MKPFQAYANGVLDGFNEGVSDNPFDSETSPVEHQAYKQGYDYGVFLYTQKNNGE
jgi:hypothetical protein